MGGITPIAAPQPAPLVSAAPISPPIIPRANPAQQLTPPDPPKPGPDPQLGLNAVKAQISLKPPRSSAKPYELGSITYISSITIDVDNGRVSLDSPQGPPVRGDVDTDIDVGFYMLVVDRARSQWVFQSSAAKAGLRFYVTLDAAQNPTVRLDPFTFDYPDQVPLFVQHGFRPAGPLSFAATVAAIKNAVRGKSPEDAYVRLAFLNNVDLYDTLDSIWAGDMDDQSIIPMLLLVFKKAEVLELGERFRILRALESFTEKPEYLYIDNFQKWMLMPQTWNRDPKREAKGLWNIQIRFTYGRNDDVERHLIVYADSILVDANPPREKPQYGEAAVLHPRYCSQGTCPKMWAVKQKILRDMEGGNMLFYIQAWQTADMVMNYSQMAVGLAERAAMVGARDPGLLRIDPETMRLLRDEEGSIGPQKRGSSTEDSTTVVEEAVPAAKPSRQQMQSSTPQTADFNVQGLKAEREGQWRGDFPDGTNQRVEDAEYVRAVSKVPENKLNLHYKYGIEFDAAEDALGRPAAEKPDLLVECKNWKDNEYMHKVLTGRMDFERTQKIGEKFFAQANDQVKAADGIRIEWRVRGEQVAQLLQRIFDIHKLPIKVVHRPWAGLAKPAVKK